MSAPDTFSLVAEVNEVGSFDGKPRVSLMRENERTKKAAAKKAGARGREVWFENVGEINLTREQARWFGARLYRKIRVTFEDAGPLDAAEVAEAERLEQMTLEDLEAEDES